MRSAFIDAIFELAAQDPRVAYIGSDLSPELMARMQAEMPGRAFMEGVSEQACVDMAAGMAMDGMIPWVHTIATFLTRRSFEQIALAAQQNLPVRLLGNGGGLIYSHLGPSHLALDDIALMRSIPNMTVICPCDAEEARQLALASKDYPGPIYFRVGWTQEPCLSPSEIFIGIPRLARQWIEPSSASVLMVSTGSITAQAVDASELLINSGIWCRVLHCHTVKPLDLDGIVRASRDVELIVIVEEHSLIGGLCSAVADAANMTGALALTGATLMLGIGIPDVWPERYGTRDELLTIYGLQPDQIADRIKRELA